MSTKTFVTVALLAATANAAVYKHDYGTTHCVGSICTTRYHGCVGSICRPVQPSGPPANAIFLGEDQQHQPKKHPKKLSHAAKKLLAREAQLLEEEAMQVAFEEDEEMDELY